MSEPRERPVSVSATARLMNALREHNERQRHRRAQRLSSLVRRRQERREAVTWLSRSEDVSQ